MNLSHFNHHPLFTWYGDLPKAPGHDLYTQMSTVVGGLEAAVIYCRCGWFTSRTLKELLVGGDALFREMSYVAHKHIQAQLEPPAPSLGELTELGWFDPGVW